MELAEQDCVPCRGGASPFDAGQIQPLLVRLGAGWEDVNGHHLAKSYKFADFQSALAFTNRIGELAEEQGHHPDIHLSWGLVKVEIWTHAVDGLSESDFVLAAKIDKLLR